MVPHTPPFVDGDTSQENRVTAEWLNWVNERVTDTERFLGFFDASSGDLPQVAFPAATFLAGDNYEISVAGTLDVVDPATLLSAPTAVNVGDFIRWVYNSPTNPDGWYHVVPSSTVIASNVGFTATLGISATNVQDAIEELEADAVLLADLIAANVVYTPSGDLVAVNVQDALDELESEKAPLAAETAVGTSFAPTGIITSTDVQNAIEDLLTLIGGGGGGGGGYASSITNVPAGNISATNVQAAINELDSDKVAKAGDTMTGDLVGTNSYWDIVGVGNFAGPGSGNYTITADGSGELTIADDTSFSFVLGGAGSSLTSSLAIGGSVVPNANAGLDLLGTKPMLLPRLTTAQRTAATGVEGMFCFDTDLNTVYQYTGSAWAVPGAAASAPAEAFIAWRSGNQGILGNIQQKILLNTLDNNKGGGFSTANSRFVAGAGGLYQFSWHVVVSNATSMFASLYVNGVPQAWSDYTPSGAVVRACVGSKMVVLAPTDVVELYVYVTASAMNVRGNDTTDTYLTGYLVGPAS